MTLATRLRHLYAGALVLICLGGVFACARNGNDMNPTAAHSPDITATDPMAQFRNPKPSQALRITMTITGAPGPFAWMRPIAHFDVTNRECLSPPKDKPGGRSAPVPTAPTAFELSQRGERVYTGVVYADLMQDRNYNGHGVCYWELTSIVVQMKATGAKGETFYTPAITGDKLSPGESVTVWFNKISYPTFAGSEPTETEFAHPGLPDRARFGPSIKDSDLFTVRFDIADEALP